MSSIILAIVTSTSCIAAFPQYYTANFSNAVITPPGASNVTVSLLSFPTAVGICIASSTIKNVSLPGAPTPDDKCNEGIKHFLKAKQPLVLSNIINNGEIIFGVTKGFMPPDFYIQMTYSNQQGRCTATTRDLAADLQTGSTTSVSIDLTKLNFNSLNCSK